MRMRAPVAPDHDSLGHEAIEEAALMLQRTKVAIRARFAALALSEAEVQGLVVAAWAASEFPNNRGRRFSGVYVAKTVARWRRQRRVDEQYSRLCRT